MHHLDSILFQDEVAQLEFDVEIQKKIVNAARRLAREHGMGRSMKRDRKMATQRALLKLQELERKLQSAKKFQRPANVNETLSDGLVSTLFIPLIHKFIAHFPVYIS